VPLRGDSPPATPAIPQEDDLRSLFAAAALPSFVPQTVTSVPPAGGTSPSYYFLDEAVLGHGGVRVPSTTGEQWQPALGQQPSAAYDVYAVRRDFPILQETVNGHPLVWLDNAATTHKPQAVIDRLSYFYAHENSNVHRAAHELAARATDAYEAAREKVRVFLGAASTNEIIFVRGATEAINLVAKSWGRQNIGSGDEIVVSWLEHHANIVPWQQLASETGARLRVIPVDDTGQIILPEYAKILGPRTKLVSIAQVSNALGTVTPVHEVVAMAHAVGAKALVDGAQAVSHMRVNVQELDSDWYVFSGHKVFGPTGIGVVHGKEPLLNGAQPWQGGGNMIADVSFERTAYQDAPARFEAGTGNIADAVGLGAAIDYVTQVGIDRITAYEHQLLVYATRFLKEIPGLRLIGTAAEKAGVLSFVIDGHRTQDIGHALNREGIAVRAGHHCAQPILRRFGVETTVRPSLALYNTCSDVDALIAALIRITSNRTTPPLEIAAG
jgi:cysteine desulfurase/selenocysteine lyase